MALKRRNQISNFVIGIATATFGILFTLNSAHSAQIANFRINVRPTTVGYNKTVTVTGAFQIVGTGSGPFDFDVDLLDSDAPVYGEGGDVAGLDEILGSWGSFRKTGSGSVSLPALTFNPSAFITETGEGNTLEVYGLIRYSNLSGTHYTPTVNVTVVPTVPEPFTLLSTITALSFGIFFKRKLFRKHATRV